MRSGGQGPSNNRALCVQRNNSPVPEGCHFQAAAAVASSVVGVWLGSVHCRVVAAARAVVVVVVIWGGRQATAEQTRTMDRNARLACSAEEDLESCSVWHFRELGFL